jgi:hypothetical protein
MVQMIVKLATIQGISSAATTRNSDKNSCIICKTRKFSHFLHIQTTFHQLVHLVIGTVPANFSEFSHVLASFIQIDGIPANYQIIKPN